MNRWGRVLCAIVIFLPAIFVGPEERVLLAIAGFSNEFPASIVGIGGSYSQPHEVVVTLKSRTEFGARGNVGKDGRTIVGAKDLDLGITKRCAAGQAVARPMCYAWNVFTDKTLTLYRLENSGTDSKVFNLKRPIERHVLSAIPISDVVLHDFNEGIWPILVKTAFNSNLVGHFCGIGCGNRGFIRVLGGSDGFPSRIGGHSGVNGRSDRGDHRKESEEETPDGNPCLLKSEHGGCLGGVRRTSLLYQVVCFQAMLFFGLIAGISAAKAFRPGEPIDLRWAALVPAGIIAGSFFLIAGITGKVWLFGL